MKRAKTLKWLLTLACLLAALCAFTLAANAGIVGSGKCGLVDIANGLDGSQLKWTLDDSGTLTISGTGAMKDYSSDYSYYSGESYYYTTAPWGNSESNVQRVKTVIIQNSVTSIGDSAFFGCTGLTSVTIPNSVTSIGNHAFWNCVGLTNVTIPGSVTSIGNYTFKGCTGLASVTIENGVTSIGYDAFYDCTGLTSVTIPDSVSSIGDSAFFSCTGLSNVTIPDSITSIGNSAFIGTAWFSNQPDGLVYVGKFVYGYKGTMVENTSITLKNGTKGIADGAFYNLRKLTSVMIPDGVKVIGKGSFKDCTGLSSVAIPNSVTSIGDSAFENCTGLTSVTIPNSVASIGEKMFYRCEGLTSVTIPSSVTSIEDWAFGSCGSLASVMIPDSVTRIGEYAFDLCTSLTIVTIPDSVTSIGNHAFEYTAWFSNQPDGLVYAGKVAYQFKGDMAENTSITLNNGTKGIADWAFSACTGMTSLTIPDSVTSIGECAFVSCKGLTSITIPNSVTSIGRHAFWDCVGLTNVTIPGSVTSIGNYTFEGCTGLASVTIENGVTSIGQEAFHECTNLTSVIIPASVMNIGRSAFRGCSNIKKIYYTGTQKQWYAIKISSENENLTKNVTYNYNSTTPTDSGADSGATHAEPFNPLSKTETYQINGILDDYVITVVLNGSEVYVEKITISGKVYNVKKDLLSEEKAEQLKGKNVICNYDKKADKIIAISKCREFKDLNQTDISTINNEKRISVMIANEYKWSSGKVRVAGGTREVSQIPFEIMISNSIPSNYFDLSDPCKNNSVFDISISSVSITGLENCGQIYLTDDSFPKTVKLGDTIYLEGVITLPSDFWLGYADSEKTITAEYEIQMNSGKEKKVFQTVVKNRDPKPQLQNENNLLTDAVNKLKRTGNNAISLVGLEADLGFSRKQIQFLEKLVLIELSLYTMPEESIEEYVNKKVLEKIFGAKSYIGVKTGKLTIVVPYENRTKQLDIVCDITDYSLNNRTFGNFTNLTYHAYNIKNGKREKEAFLDGTAGLYVSANVEAFAESATDLALSQIKSATKTALNGYEEVERILFGETALKILSAAGYDSALDFGWELYVNKCKELAFACPVDIYVYDQNDTLCGAIVNNEVTLDTSDDIDLKIMNDEKIVTLWEDGYYVKILANCKGTLNISVSEKGYTSGAVRTLNFENIPLSVGKLIKQGCGIGYYDDQSAFAVEELNGDKIEATSDSLSLQFEQVIDIHEHTYTTVVTLPATCGADGVITFTCECGDSYTEEIPATGEHTFGEWTVTKEATVHSEGEEVRTCSVCGEIETRTIPKAEPVEPEFTPGDADGDGKLTSADARLALRASVGLRETGDVEKDSAAYHACDVDGDGKVTSADARLILRASVGLGDAGKFGKKA